MNKLISFMKNFLLFGLPVLIMLITSTALIANFTSQNSFYDKLVHQYIGLSVMVCITTYFFILFLFLLLLVSNANARETTLKKLANLQEQDEREEFITGKAARASYISTLSLIIFILFLSLFNMSLYKNPKEQVNKPHYIFSINFGYHAFTKADNQQNRTDTTIFETKNLLPSTSTILIIILAWQLISFNLTARREKHKII